MLTRYARAATRRILTPLARGLLRIGVGPDLVTFIGTLGVCVGALAFYPRGSFFPGSVVITLFVLLDTVDGTMARLTGRRSSWGAFLDSTSTGWPTVRSSEGWRCGTPDAATT